MPRRPMGPRLRFCLVIAGPASYMLTFAIVILYDLIYSTALFGSYAIALGLSRGFMTAASLRGRLLLLAARSPSADYIPLQQLVTTASVVGVILTMVVALDTDFLLLAVLIATVRLAENVFSVYISWVQISDNPDRAIVLSLFPNLLQVAVYCSLFVTGSLTTTVALEAAATVTICIALVRQRHALRDGARSRFRSLIGLVAAFSLASLLNNLFATALIRYLLGEDRKDLAAIAAGFFVVAAVAARLSSNAALFYSDGLATLLDFLTTNRTTLATVGLFGGFCFALTFLLDSIAVRYALLSMLVVAATFNLLIRQSLALEGSLRTVILLHSAELLAGFFFFRTIQDLSSLAQFFVVWQILRLYTLVPVWNRAGHSGGRELGPNPVE